MNDVMKRLRLAGNRYRSLTAKKDEAADDLRDAILEAVDAGFTQAEAAQVVKLTQSRVSQIMRGTR